LMLEYISTYHITSRDNGTLLNKSSGVIEF